MRVNIQLCEFYFFVEESESFLHKMFFLFLCVKWKVFLPNLALNSLSVTEVRIFSRESERLEVKVNVEMFEKQVASGRVCMRMEGL